MPYGHEMCTLRVRDVSPTAAAVNSIRKETAMYTFPSPPRGKPLHVLTVACYVAAIIFLGVSSTDGIPYPMIYQMAAILTAAAGIYFTTRYVLRQYRYTLETGIVTDANGRPTTDLIITEVVGKKITVVARIGLRDVASVTVIRESDKDKRTKRTAICQDKRVFTYINTPFYTAACYIDVPEEHSVLVIPPDDTMINYLRSHT